MIIATDIGYSHTKGATDGRRVIFPSVVGEVQTAHLEALGQGDDYLQIETDEGAWFVGQAAVEQSGMTTRRQDRKWIETPEYHALTLAAIAEITGATGVTVELVTGLPVAYFSDHANLTAWLKQVHTVKRAGRRAQRIQIADVIVLPQGLAAVLSEALDSQGKIRPGPVSQGMVGLIDIGGHTVNVATFKALREITRQTASIDAGMWGPVTEIGKRVNAAYPGLNLVGHEIADAIQAGKVHFFGQDRDITGICQDVLRPFARQIMAVATQTWGNAARLDSLLVAGGGGEVVIPALVAEYPHARVVSDPQWANVNGYLRFAWRRWGKR